jgi:glyoxylase I family protein
MPQFRGVDHFALTVTDLAVSHRFYTEVLEFLPVLDFGYGLALHHKGTGFTIGLIQHSEGTGGDFSELTTGLDHLGFAADSRAELTAWEAKLREHEVTYTPVRDTPLGRP